MALENVLVTGFEPFDDFEINPSAEVALSLDGGEIEGLTVVGAQLPLDYTSCLSEARRLIGETAPAVIIACGQANRGAITLERIAINAVSTQREDNYGNLPETDVIIPDGPAAYFSMLDVTGLAQRLREMGIPAEVSYHAGTYGCNWLFYNLLHWRHTGQISGVIGFVHVPPLPEQAIQKRTATLPTMRLDDEMRAIRTVIAETARGLGL